MVQSNLLILGMFILSAGGLATITSIFPLIMIKLFPSRRGFGISLGTSFQNIAGMIGPIVMGLFINLAGANKVLGFHYAIFYMAGLMLLAGLLFILFCKPDETVAEAAQQADKSVSI